MATATAIEAAAKETVMALMATAMAMEAAVKEMAVA